MPSTRSGHGDSAGRPQRPTHQTQDGYFSMGSVGREDAGRSAQKGKRTAIAIAVEDEKHLLSPLMKTLPALPNLASLRTFLPTSPPPAAPSPKAPSPDKTYSKWQSADLRDGNGRQNLLLVSSPDCALRVIRAPPSQIPDDPQIVEEAPVPEEIFSSISIRRHDGTRKSQLGRKEQAKVEGRETVISAQLVDHGDMVEEYGPIVLLLTSSAMGRSGQAAFALVVVALRTGLAEREVALGIGKAASLQASARAIAIAISEPSTIHLLHPSTLRPFHTLADLPSYPTFALSGRLLAFATEFQPRSTGSSGLGTLISAHSVPRARVASEGADRRSSPGTSASSAIVSSAASIGGGVARGVWAGIKMGAAAANQANAARLARSAPANGSILVGEDELLSESRSADSSGPDFPAEGIGGSAVWIKVIDLGRLPPVEVSSPYDSPSKPTPVGIRTIAHFRLPIQSLSPHSSSRGVAFLSWNMDGTQLFVAPDDGRVFDIFQIHPDGPGVRSRSDTRGEMLHLYELKRGNTAARVQEVVWDEMGRWVGVATERGTIHVYPIQPSGAPASVSTHTTAKIVNPSQLYPLSQIVDASVRLRHRPLPSSPTRAESPDHAVSFAFARWQQHPLEKSFCLDVLIFRSSMRVIELQRLSVKPVAPTPEKRSSTVVKKGSGISEMMRLKGSRDLDLRHETKAKWSLPDADEDLEIATGQHAQIRMLVPLANAEIRTYSVNPRILPLSIYLSHQVDFFSADAASPHMGERSSRLRRLTYRKEVQVKSETSSFDEPLSTALQSRIDSPTRGEIPGLPNGPPSAKWRSPIPIRTVAAGVGEGLDRVRQTYVKAQAIRRHRRASEHAANRLSFEEGAIFASSPNGLGLDVDDSSSPASEPMPASESAIGDDDEEWAEGWEEEYRRASEIEGEPDDLVLGLLDEEEEERRVAVRAKAKAKR